MKLVSEELIFQSADFFRLLCTASSRLARFATCSLQLGCRSSGQLWSTLSDWTVEFCRNHFYSDCWSE